MKQKALYIILLIILFSVITGLVLHYAVGFAVKKAAWIAGGAGVAMIIFDILVPQLRSRKAG